MKDAVVQRKKIRVKTLMLLSIFLTVTVGFTATIGFMMWQWDEATRVRQALGLSDEDVVEAMRKATIWAEENAVG